MSLKIKKRYCSYIIHLIEESLNYFQPVIRKMKTEGRRILKSGQSIANSGGKKKEIMRDIQITGMQKE